MKYTVAWRTPQGTKKLTISDHFVVRYRERVFPRLPPHVEVESFFARIITDSVIADYIEENDEYVLYNRNEDAVVFMKGYMGALTTCLRGAHSRYQPLLDSPVVEGWKPVKEVFGTVFDRLLLLSPDDRDRILKRNGYERNGYY